MFQMRKKTKKINLKKFILFLFILFLFFIFIPKIKNLFSNYSNFDFLNLGNSNYPIIKLDENKNYSGIGQEKVKNKDGYFTTFTTEEKPIKNINKMVILPGVIKNIGVVLCLKMVVELL